jgi:hypothetical protein
MKPDACSNLEAAPRSYAGRFCEKLTTPKWAPIHMKIFFLSIAGLTLLATASFAQVDVKASGGLNASYTTLKGAFDAINGGTHTGTINIGISGNTTETATAALNASGSGAASYTSLRIKPAGGARTITGNIVGAIIKLNGADNVTIDGRIGASPTSNLTVSNSNASTATAAIWLASVAPGNGASNNVIRNLNLACGADQQAAAIATFGIIQTGTTISVSSTDGNDNDNNSFIANTITRVRYGIVSKGVSANNNIAPVITDNVIGPVAFGPDQIGKAGIYMAGDTGAIISRNTIRNVGALSANAASGADRLGITIGGENWDGANAVVFAGGDYTVTKNVIHDIVDKKLFQPSGFAWAPRGAVRRPITSWPIILFTTFGPMAPRATRFAVSPMPMVIPIRSSSTRSV